MNKTERENYARKVLNVLGIEKINNLHKHQEQSLDNQLDDLLEAHDYDVETVTDDEIIGRYKLVTEYIYPDEFVQLEKHLKFND